MQAIREDMRFAYHEDLERIRDTLNEFIIAVTKSQTLSDEFRKEILQFKDICSDQVIQIQSSINNFKAVMKVLGWVTGTITVILSALLSGGIEHLIKNLH